MKKENKLHFVYSCSAAQKPHERTAREGRRLACQQARSDKGKWGKRSFSGKADTHRLRETGRGKVHSFNDWETERRGRKE